MNVQADVNGPCNTPLRQLFYCLKKDDHRTRKQEDFLQ